MTKIKARQIPDRSPDIQPSRPTTAGGDFAIRVLTASIRKNSPLPDHDQMDGFQHLVLVKRAEVNRHYKETTR
jgi:hypothetical protein